MHRPTSVTVFGILNLVFAALGVCGVVLGIVGLVFMANIENMADGAMPPNPQLELLKNPSYQAYTYAMIGLNSIASIVLAVAGIGLLKLKSWGRTLSIGYGAYAIIMQLVGLAVAFVFVVQPAMQAAEAGNDPQAQGQMVGSVIGAAFGGCFGLIYPALLLFFMFRKNVKAAFGTDPEVANMQGFPDDNPDDNPYANPMS
jgi:hypothetical protein